MTDDSTPGTSPTDSDGAAVADVPESDGATVGSGTGSPERASIGRNMFDMLSSQVVSFALGFVLQVTIPRFIGPAGVGQVQLAFSIWLIAQVFVAFGTSAYLMLVMSRDRERGIRLVGPVILVRLALFVVVSAGVALYAWAVSYEREILILLAIAGGSMLLTFLHETLAAAFTGMELMRYPAVVTIVAKFAYTVAMVVVLVLGGDIYAVALTTTLNSALTLLLLGILYHRVARISWARPGQGYRGLLAVSFGFMVTHGLIVIYLQIDMVTMSLLIDDTALGWYTVADILMSSLLFVPTIAISVLFPVVSRLHVDDDSSMLQLVRRTLSTLVLLGTAIGLGTFVIAEPFCVLLYGEDFRDAGHVLALFGLALPLIFVTMLLGTVAQATDRKGFWSSLMAGAIAGSIVFDVIFVPLFDDWYGNGAIGGALGYLVTEAAIVAIGLRWLVPEVMNRSVWIRFGKIAVAGALMVAASYPLRHMLLIVPIVVGAAVFVIAVFALKVLTAEERDMLRPAIDKIRRGPTAPPEPTEAGRQDAESSRS